jgi:hypothetical protein
MNLITMPTFIVKKNVFFGKKKLIRHTIHHFLDGNRIKNDSKWITGVLELEIAQFLGHIFGKTRTQRQDF